MKIVCIYGQNHKGSTYHIAKIRVIGQNVLMANPIL